MADHADHAQRVIEADLERRIAAARGVMPAGPGPEDCERCDEPIPEARRVALPGVRVCVYCAQKTERTRGGRSWPG
jgi:phage/conjugal plasmid C-4 type zinc finger TraR family protein